MNPVVEKFRKDCTESDGKRDAGLTTPENIVRHDDISYGPHGVWNLLDVYYTKDIAADEDTQNNPVKRPVIINIHGGAWVYGTKEVYQFYCMDLAQRGFTVVNFNYRLAPENLYPAALEDINQVFCFIKEEAQNYPMDLNNLFVVGDSAGAQLASQYLTILTNPAYARLFDFKVPRLSVKAVALNCGLYDAGKCAEYGLDEYLCEYVGPLDAAKRKSLSVLKYINEKFPATYLASACHDFLLENTAPMHEHLAKLGIECQMKIYGTREQEEMGHVFHINIKLPGAQTCNENECKFFKAHCEAEEKRV